MMVGGRDLPAGRWEGDDEPERDGRLVLIDQRRLPHHVEDVRAATVAEAAHLIREMAVRGAPAIGAAAAYGMVLGRDDPARAAEVLRAARPTARDLFTAVDHMLRDPTGSPSRARADAYVADVVERCARIGTHGRRLFEEIASERGRLHVMTHCHAGALATVDHGTALAPLHALVRRPLPNGIEPFVWVGETRPRMQGAITSWELGAAGVRHRVFADNAAAHLLQRGEVDVVVTGADRIARNGDVANKVGTYTRALAAAAHDVPFYVAAPVTTFDPRTSNGFEIQIEERDEEEVLAFQDQRPYAAGTRATNPAFDVTPSKIVRGFITENGVFPPDRLQEAFHDRSMDV